MKSLALVLIYISSFNAVAQSDTTNSLYETQQILLERYQISYSLDELESLHWLKLNDIDLSGHDLTFISKLRRLEKLDLTNTRVDNQVVAIIKHLTYLEELWAEGTLIDDKGFIQLSTGSRLKKIHLSGSVSDETIRQLNMLLPYAKIERGFNEFELNILYGVMLFFALVLVGIFLVIYLKANYISKGARAAAAFGIYFFLAFFIFLYHAIHFSQVAITADGKVIDLVKHTSRNSDGHRYTSYHPKVLFTAMDGRVYVFESSVGSTPLSYDIEESVSVLYDPQNPNDAEINSFFGILAVWLYPLTMILLASILLSSSGFLRPFIEKFRNPGLVEALNMLQGLGIETSYEELTNSNYCDLDLKKKKIQDKDMELLKNIKLLTHLNLSKTPITDAGVAHLSSLHQLTGLDLSKTAITDLGVKHLAKIPNLKKLELNKTAVTNKAVEYLAGSKIEGLDLDSTQLDNQVIPLFDQLPNLKRVSLLETKVDEDLFLDLLGKLAQSRG